MHSEHSDKFHLQHGAGQQRRVIYSSDPDQLRMNEKKIKCRKSGKTVKHEIAPISDASKRDGDKTWNAIA